MPRPDVLDNLEHSHADGLAYLVADHSADHGLSIATGYVNLAGLHHLAWITDDLDAIVTQAERDGLQVVFQAESPGTRVVYLEAKGENGILFEFIESPQTRQLIIDGIAAM